MKFPCELTVWYVLPAVRSELAKELARLGLSQKDISEKLDITQAAVSQYVNDKRGNSVKFKRMVMGEIKRLAKDIKNGNDLSVVPRVCRICDMIKADKTICGVHRKRDRNVPKGCDACFVG